MSIASMHALNEAFAWSELLSTLHELRFHDALHEHVLDSELFSALLSRANEAAILSHGSCSMNISFMHAYARSARARA